MKMKFWILPAMLILSSVSCQPFYVRMMDPEPFEPISTESTITPEPIGYLPSPFNDIQPQETIEYSEINPQSPGHCRFESCGIKVYMSGEESGLINYEVEMKEDVFFYLIDHLILTINNEKLPSNFPTGYFVEYNDQNQIMSIRFNWNATLLPGVHQFDLKYTAPSGAVSEISWRLLVIDDRGN
jgi:hypothetical protein